MFKPFMLIIACLASSAALASGECPLRSKDSGERAQWQSQDKLRDQLTHDGWQVRRVKVEGACYEVYALDKSGHKVEAYFHPKTLEPLKR